jgi:hypothetical protein
VVSGSGGHGGFDPERYLRFLGEDELRAVAECGSAWPWTPMAVAAEVLVAVGRFGRAAADGLVAEYRQLAALRERSPGRGPLMATLTWSPPLPPPAAVAPRVVPVGRRYRRDWGELEVHYVVLADTTQVVVSLLLPEIRGMTAFAAPELAGLTVGEACLADDRGTVIPASYCDADVRSALRQRGWLASEQALARDTSWIDVGDLRVELTGEAVRADVVSEPFRPVDVAYGVVEKVVHDVYRGGRLEPVRELLADSVRSPVETVLSTLVAAGEIHAGDPVIASTRLAVEAMNGEWDAPLPAGLGEPWKSVLGRRGRAASEFWRVVQVVDATLPTVDGRRFATEAVVGSPTLFELRLTELAPDRAESDGPVAAPARSLLDPLGAFGSAPGPQPRKLRWSAVDDHGGHYVGGDVVRGTPLSRPYVQFVPALEPTTEWLRISVCGRDRRVGFTVVFDDRHERIREDSE